LTLALGIGANIAVFSIVHAVILRSLSYPESEQLVHLSTHTPAMGLTQLGVSPPEYIDFRRLNQSFS
jgi:putative ABC transport system permease protein